MDAWTPKQIAAMEKSGGNAALIEFLKSRGIDKGWPIAAKYSTKQAAYYRDRLSRWLEGKTEPPPDPGRYDPISGGDAQGAEPLPGETPEQYNARQARLREVARERLRQKFGDKGMGGVGSDPNPGCDDGLGFGGLVGGAAGLAGGAVGLVGGVVGGALSGVGGFLKNSVIENDGLHSSIRGTLGTVGETASGAWCTIRRSLGDGDLVNSITRSATLEDGVISRSVGWTAGTVGNLWDKASQSIGDLVGDGDMDDHGQIQAPRCNKGHRLRTECRPGEKCSLCGAKGTRYACSQGCDFDICTKCFEKPPRSAGGTRERVNKKGSVDFDDDEWSTWADEPEKAPPPVPTHDDMNRLAQDLGMKLGNPVSPARKDSAGNASPAPVATSDLAWSTAMEVNAPSPAKAKAKAKLPDGDDFFGEFGL